MANSSWAFAQRAARDEQGLRRMFFLSLFKKSRHKQYFQHIATALNTVYRHRVPLYVEHVDLAYTAAFLISEIDKKSNTLVLMSLTPDEHNVLFEIGQTITLSTLPNSYKNIKCVCKIQMIQQENLSIVTLHFPQAIESLERRQVMRTKIGNSLRLQVVINCAKGIPVIGYLHDLSKQGICLCFDEDIQEQLKINQATHLCHLQLSDVKHY